jgi:hypothetical protein
MKGLHENAPWLFEKLQFTYQPIGLILSNKKPEMAVLLPLYFQLQKGKSLPLTTIQPVTHVRHFILAIQIGYSMA